jgi:hypothetical protein
MPGMYPIMPKAIKSYQQLQNKSLQPDAKKNGTTTTIQPPPTVFVLPQTQVEPPKIPTTLVPAPGTPIRPIPITARPQSSPGRSNPTMPSPSKLINLNDRSKSPTTPVISSQSPQYVSPFNDILNSCDPDCFVIRSRDQSLEYREFTESDMPVVTYSFTEDSINSMWNLNLIWPVDRRQLSWRGKFVFFVRVYKRVNHDTYSHMMSKISSPFSIFSKPDVYLKKIRKESGKKTSPSSDIEDSGLSSSQELSQNSQTIPSPQPKGESLVPAANGIMPIALNTPILPTALALSSFNRFAAIKQEVESSTLKRKRSPPNDANEEDEENISGKERVKRRFVNGSKHKNASKHDDGHAAASNFLAFVDSVGSQGDDVHIQDENSNTDSSDNSNSAFTPQVGKNTVV